MSPPNETDKPEQPNANPLYSSLMEQAPEFGEILHQFVNKLPELIFTIETAYRSQDWQELMKVTHNLKGMGGGFGYPQLTEQAVEIERYLIQGEYLQIDQAIVALQNLSERIQAGLPD